MKSFDENWTRAEALQVLFFSDLAELQQGFGEKRLRELISEAFYGITLRSTALSSPQRETLLKAVQAVMATLPHLTATSALHPLLWVRWALQSSALPISNGFWLHLTQWRAGKKPTFARMMQYYDPNKKTWRGKVRTVQGVGKSVGYTLDQILVHKKFAFNEYAVRWRIKLVQFAAPRVQHAVPRTVETVCGQESMRVLSECVRLEAEAGTSGLLLALRDGKYTCTVSPAKLLEELKSRNLALKRYSDSTLRRGLSAFVRCPRGRPGGFQPPCL